MMNPLVSMYQTMMGNPNQFIQNMMANNNIMNNPMAKNALQMMQSGDGQGLHDMAVNMCKERGIDADKAMQHLKQQLGIR